MVPIHETKPFWSFSWVPWVSRGDNELFFPLWLCQNTRVFHQASGSGFSVCFSPLQQLLSGKLSVVSALSGGLAGTPTVTSRAPCGMTCSSPLPCLADSSSSNLELSFPSSESLLCFAWILAPLAAFDKLFLGKELGSWGHLVSFSLSEIMVLH